MDLRWTVGSAMLSVFVVVAVVTDSVWAGMVGALVVGALELLYIRWRGLDESRLRSTEPATATGSAPGRPPSEGAVT
jgi:hypothetical protein